MVMCGGCLVSQKKIVYPMSKSHSIISGSFHGFFKGFYNLSAFPFETGGYGEDRECWIPFDFKNLVKSSDINCDLLSVTIFLVFHV